MTENEREKFEAAVIERLKESGFSEVEIRVEGLVRCDDSYQDEVISAGWHYWNAALAAQPTPAPQHKTAGLNDLIEKSKAKLAAMSEEERQAMWQAQRESFVRAMTTPCEHGVLDFEQCPQCRAPAPAKLSVGGDTPQKIDRERAAKAAVEANNAFGQWMPERWLHLFLDAYEGKR